MKTASSWFVKQIALCVALALTSQLAQAAPMTPLQEPAVQPSQPSPAPQPPGVDNQAQPTQPEATQAVPPQEQNGDSKPVGTAAAPLGKSSGVAASRPAGAVIAPAKQRRARAILIRVGIVVGAAVAVGTVVALSKVCPSRPN